MEPAYRELPKAEKEKTSAYDEFKRLDARRRSNSLIGAGLLILQTGITVALAMTKKRR